MNVKVLNNQRLVDLSMQEYGDPAMLFDVALAVDKGITDELLDVLELDMPALNTTAKGKSISQVLKKIFNNPASADDDAIDFFMPPGGIGYMKLTWPENQRHPYDFIVS